MIRMMVGVLVLMELQTPSLKIEYNGLTLMAMDLGTMELVPFAMIVQKSLVYHPLIYKDVLMLMEMVIQIVSAS